MSKISLSPDVAGTGIFTIASPNSNTNRTLTLPDDTGTIVTNSGNQAGSFTTLNTSGAVVFNDAGADVDFRVEGDTDANLLFVDASTDRVGVGTSTPTRQLDVSKAGTAYIRASDTTNSVNVDMLAASSGGWIGTQSNHSFQFQTNNTERGRFTSGGDLLVGKTATSFSTAGSVLYANGTADFIATDNVGVDINRLTTDGDLIRFFKDGTQVGAIGSYSGLLRIGTGSANLVFNDGTGVVPALADGNASDNLLDFGAINRRWDDIYATNGTIQTSDRNEKQDIEELSEAETRVAVAAKGLLRKYRWKDAVAEKGDDARIHFGIIAQDLKASFEAEGLDAGRYAMFIHSAWWEKERIIPAVEGKEAVLDDDGNVVEEAVEAQPERTVIDTFETEEEAGEGAVRKERMGIRYNELLAFIIAAI